jgi:hypothetical protein
MNSAPAGSGDDRRSSVSAEGIKKRPGIDLPGQAEEAS